LCLGSDVEVLDEDDDVGGVFLLGLVSILPGRGFQKVCGRASSLEKRPGFLFGEFVQVQEMSKNVSYE